MRGPSSIEQCDDASGANNAFNNRSLAVASADIGRELADRGGATFYVKGTCMYPTIRPGDVLSIQSRHVAGVSVGDIAVCRRNNTYLTCHRVIEKGERGGHAFIITRSDRSRHGTDAPVFDENLLGIVVSISRTGKPVSLLQTVYPLPVRLYYMICVGLISTTYRLRLRATALLERLVRTRRYQFIARAWFALFPLRMRYEVNIPLNATLGDGIYRRFDPDTFDPNAEWKGKLIRRWSLMLYLNDSRDPAARITYERTANDARAWCKAESHICTRYYGAGLEKTLIRKAEEILMRSNI